MHPSTGHYQSLNVTDTQTIKKKKSTKADEAAAAEVKVAPYCVNKDGEQTPKTDLSRLIAASGDCI